MPAIAQRLRELRIGGGVVIVVTDSGLRMGLESTRVVFVDDREFQVILVIDDNSAVLSMTNAMLTRYGYRTISSLSGKQAIETLEEWSEIEVDLALIDVVLEDMTGPDVAKAIWRLKPCLPVIFMTGFPEHREFLSAQGQFVLRKPFTSLCLIKTIRGLLDEHKQQPSTVASGP